VRDRTNVREKETERSRQHFATMKFLVESLSPPRRVLQNMALTLTRFVHLLSWRGKLINEWFTINWTKMHSNVYLCYIVAILLLNLNMFILSRRVRLSNICCSSVARKYFLISISLITKKNNTLKTHDRQIFYMTTVQWINCPSKSESIYIKLIINCKTQAFKNIYYIFSFILLYAIVDVCDIEF